MGGFSQLVRRYVRDWMDRPHAELHDAEPPATEEVAAPCGPGGPRFRLLSLNVWGLPHTPHFAERMRALERLVANNTYDVLALQEAWLWQDREQLKEAATRGGMTHHYYFRHGVGVPGWPNQSGSGLLVLSRHPIVDAAFLRYPVCGIPYRFDHLDGVSGKGAGLVRILVPGIQRPVDVYVTHLVSVYTPSGLPGPVHTDTYRAHRVAQAYELGKFVRATRQGDLVVLAGDFNSPGSSLCLRLVRELSGMADSFEATGREAGPTFSAPDNLFADLPRALRLDHLLFSTRARAYAAEGAPPPRLPNGCVPDDGGPLWGWDEPPSGRPLPSWRCVTTAVCKHVVTDDDGKPVMRPAARDGRAMPLMISDHYGVSVEFAPIAACSPASSRSRPASRSSSWTSLSRAAAALDDADAKQRRRVRKTMAESRGFLRDGLADAKSRQRGHCSRSLAALLVVLALWFGLVPAPAAGLGAFFAQFLMLCGLPYAMVEIILGAFTVEAEIVVLQETLQEINVDIGRLRFRAGCNSPMIAPLVSPPAPARAVVLS